MHRSRVALVIALVYGLLVIAAFVIMLATLQSTPMAGIFLVLLTQPWPALVGALDGGQSGSALVSGILLLAGGMVNGVLLYVLVRVVYKLFSRKAE